MNDNAMFLSRIHSLIHNRSYPQTGAERAVEATEINNLNPNISEKHFAFVENFDFHGDCIPSYIKYFLDLGFSVDLYITKAQASSGLFDCCAFDSAKLNVYTFTKFPTSEKFFDHLAKYKFVFLLTLFCREKTYYSKLLINYFEKNGILDKFYCINHATFLYPTNKDLELKVLKHTFTLRDGIKFNDKEYPFISPIYFGEFANKIKMQKNKIVKFACFMRNVQSNMKNYSALFDAIRKLLAEGIENFEIIFTGITEQDIAQYVDESVKRHLKLVGKLPYKDMYNMVLEADYILLNIDETTKDYKKYLTGGISALCLLSLGFVRPCIIDSTLGKQYHLENSAILYEFGAIYDAMKRAITMSDDEYNQMERNLSQVAEDLKYKSIANIKELFNA